MVPQDQAGHVTVLSAVEEAVSMVWMALILGNVVTEVTASLVTDTNIMAFLETGHIHLEVDCPT